MKSGKCPKCGSLNIYSDIEKKNSNESSMIGVNAFKAFSVNHYICLECLYLEKYLDEKWDLEKIKKNWTKV
jgi:predicted nucleic-acid-binding Zn-ribbon protein